MTNAASIASHGRTGRVKALSIASLGKLMALTTIVKGFIKIGLVRISEYVGLEIVVEDSV